MNASQIESLLCTSATKRRSSLVATLTRGGSDGRRATGTSAPRMSAPVFSIATSKRVSHRRQ
jgi:hypothetical protein